LAVIYIAYTIHVVVCLFLILVVLLQQGKGADLSVFGGGSTQSAFGARGAATLLHKMTVFGFVAFIVTTVTIGFLQSGGSTDSVMSTVPEEEVAVPVPAESTAVDEAAIPVPEAPAAADDAAVEEGPADAGVAEESADPPGSDQ
jgi:preprotein translocase subunit SecG